MNHLAVDVESERHGRREKGCGVRARQNGGRTSQDWETRYIQGLRANLDAFLGLWNVFDLGVDGVKSRLHLRGVCVKEARHNLNVHLPHHVGARHALAAGARQDFRRLLLHGAVDVDGTEQQQRLSEVHGNANVIVPPGWGGGVGGGGKGLSASGTARGCPALWTEQKERGPFMFFYWSCPSPVWALEIG